MNDRRNWFPRLFVALILISACSFLNNLNPFKEMTSEIEDIVDQLPVEDIQQEIDNLSTELPAEFESLATDLPSNLGDITNELETLTTDLPDDLDSMATDLPSEIDEILNDFDELFEDSLGSDNIPDDIPIIEGEKGDMFSSEKVVSYHTPLNFETVLSFYQEQMVVNGWEIMDDNVITEDATLLNFEKGNREAMIAISHIAGENNTIVMIIIQEKQ